MEAALAEQERGLALPFCTIETGTGAVVGSTRFGNIAAEHRRVEIGWTFVTPSRQRTAVNTEAKYLMLRHAFEIWDCNRVELKTSALNTRSRNAILRLGAKQEGIFRKHMINPDGSIRDTVYYSVIAEEWHGVKAHVAALLRRVITP
jgi:RimJ/RimL family protein N-acetyltransferase